MTSSPPLLPPSTDNDRLSWLRLIRSRKVGPATFRRLLGQHGSAQAALAALPALARNAGLEAYHPTSWSSAEAELQAGLKAGLTPVFLGSPDYPALLAQLADAPPVLWRKGQAHSAARPMLALVGTRNASSVGLRMAARLSQDLAELGMTTVSGLARGVDTAVHKASLHSGTVAVLPGGLARIYPPENAALAQEITETGALFSELPPDKEANSHHFPARNRLISGMSLGVVVIEAAERSGSLLTARNALDQGREVMAVPGHPVDPRAAGTNLLIREGATLIRNCEDILDAIETSLAAARALAQVQPPAARNDNPNHLPPPQYLPPAPNGAAHARQMVQLARVQGSAKPPLGTRILEALSLAPLHEDFLARSLSITAAELAPEVLILEMAGRVLRQPGGFLARQEHPQK